MTRKQHIIPLLALLCVIALLYKGAIPQNEQYHYFADQRKLWGIPNFLNVITNIPFAIIGFLGIRAWRKIKERQLNYITLTLFTGFFLLAIGSAWYHWRPANETLVYDRIPIVVILMSFFAFIIYSCGDRRTGYKAFLLLNVIGVMSVIYWAVSERMGNGDLRWYGMVQFFPLIAIPLILLLYNASSKVRSDVLVIFLFFILAKLCEKFDREMYAFFKNSISGHSLKHLLMAVGGYKIVVMVSHYVTVTNKN